MRTLTNHPDLEVAIADRVDARPYRFDDRAALAAHLDGAETLYNTFWMREGGAERPYETAVARTETLLAAAAEAGVERVVHFSVANADADGASDLPYYRGKAAAESLVRESDLASAILRPTLVYGAGDLLVNNLAWFCRHLPVFPVHGDGQYRVRPVFVGDVADVAVAAGRRRRDGDLVSVAGPDALSWDAFLGALTAGLGTRTRLVHLPPRVTQAGVRVMEAILRDPLLHWPEVQGLMRELLCTDAHPECGTAFEDWVREERGSLGTSYTRFSERYQ